MLMEVSHRSSSEYMRIEYVTVPIRTRSGAKIGEPQEVSTATESTKKTVVPFKYKEYESILQRRISLDKNKPLSYHREWPQI